MNYKSLTNLIVGFLLKCFCPVHAQYNNMIPPSPQAASIGKFGNIPLNVSTDRSSRCLEGHLEALIKWILNPIK